MFIFVCKCDCNCNWNHNRNRKNDEQMLLLILNHRYDMFHLRSPLHQTDLSNYLWAMMFMFMCVRRASLVHMHWNNWIAIYWYWCNGSVRLPYHWINCVIFSYGCCFLLTWKNADFQFAYVVFGREIVLRQFLSVSIFSHHPPPSHSIVLPMNLFPSNSQCFFLAYCGSYSFTFCLRWAAAFHSRIMF